MPAADAVAGGAVEHARPLLTSTVLAVVLRVAGPVETGVVGHGLGHPERQASVRIGDAVIHLRDPKTAALVRQRWDAGLGAALRLRERVSQTWLAPRPGTYPAAVSVQLTDQVRVTHRFVPADPDRRQPAHLEARVDQLTWLGRPGARCPDCSGSVSPGRPPNRTCAFPRIRLSTSSCRWVGICDRPGRRDQVAAPAVADDAYLGDVEQPDVPEDDRLPALRAV